MSSALNTPRDYKIAIVGGGLGGLCLAINLLQHNVPFHIYEAAPKFEEIGAGIMCGPHAVNALRLISPELLAAFLTHVTTNVGEGNPWRWGTYRFGQNIDGENGVKMSDIDLEIHPNAEVRRYLDRCGVKSASTVHRARLLDTFLSLLPDGHASFNKALVCLEQDEKEVRLVFADGTETNADAVIGCDGIKSKVRASIMKERGVFVEPEYANEYCYRSLVDMELAENILGLDLAGSPNLWQGYGGYIIHYPVEKGKLLNVVAVRQDRNSTDHNSYKSLVKTVLREEMYDDFMDWDPRLVELLRAFKTSDRWSLWHLPHNQEYSRSRVCLLGDAAHASLPHLGSGAGMAIEDAYILGNLIAEYGKKGPYGFQRAFWSYDYVRRSRTQKLLHKSQDSGRKHCLALPGVLDDPVALREYSKDQIQWVWDHDIEQNLERARGYWDVLLEQDTEAEHGNRVSGNDIECR